MTSDCSIQEISFSSEVMSPMKTASSEVSRSAAAMIRSIAYDDFTSYASPH